ncbi:hypothetical protein MKX07_006889 [Trichoderma sp. CBMAI-0711]|uniref:Zn2Cys6 transcriptional regulator n=1 Tax=Trichoderma parareesei TaxID=858221 RepID=A0A2H2ZMI7_TRIPA|nr:hypothetical protein MKX07_006889 [Trichoderma sp. CBMAI-0711]OTA01925.1 Zn2Cys6 transcriptional regulator [Trichoderma parareesei]
MVYQGKPSRGCQMCRTRRIKCDETKPTCKQCAKSRRQCPGYRDEFDLVFRNETQATEKRAQRASKKALAQRMSKFAASSTPEPISPNAAHSSGCSNPPFGSSQHMPSVTASCGRKNQQTPWTGLYTLLQKPQMDLDGQVTCHFLSNYVLIPRFGNGRGFLEYVVPLLRAEEVAPHFKAAFDACAMASYANAQGDQLLVERALRTHSKALGAINVALNNPDTIKQDSTLAAILLLGLFENITTRNLGMLAWGPHIRAAIQLVRKRGRKQLRTKIGVALFIAVRTQMIVHTLSTAKPPLMQVEWWVNSDAVRDMYASQCQRLAIRAGEIRAEVNRLMSQLPRNMESVEALRDMIRQAQAVDFECIQWAETLPEDFRYRTILWQDEIPDADYYQLEVFPGRVDAYPDLWVASLWSMMRVSRIILASLVIRCAAWVSSPVDYRMAPEYATARRICVENITDLIASVPYQLGWFSTRKHLFQQASLSSFACGEDDTTKSLSGYFLTWPLACIQGQDYTTDNQRAWVKGRLTYIGKHLGVSYALMLTQLNYRTPSMLIRMDGLMANSPSVNVEKLLSIKVAKPSEVLATGPMAPQLFRQQVFHGQPTVLMPQHAAISTYDDTSPEGD